jgi:hypothetical protein
MHLSGCIYESLVKCGKVFSLYILRVPFESCSLVVCAIGPYNSMLVLGNEKFIVFRKPSPMAMVPQEGN